MCNEQSRNMDIVKGKDGEVCIKEHSNRRRKKHFEEILNRDDPPITADVNEKHE